MGNKNKCKRVGHLLVSCGCYGDIYNKIRKAVFVCVLRGGRERMNCFLGECLDSAVSSKWNNDREQVHQSQDERGEMDGGSDRSAESKTERFYMYLLYSFLENLFQIGQSLHSTFKYFCIITVTKLDNWLLFQAID